jgi:pimeloyl-ACP methyl ester carboxylesterase
MDVMSPMNGSLVESCASPVLFAPTAPQLQQPLWVFLPGLDGTGKLLAPQVPDLVQHFDVRCLSIPSDNRQDWSALAQTVLALIREVRHQREVYLCGESFGGCLAIAVALQAPEEFSRLILVNPASSAGRLPWMSWVSQVTTYIPDWMYRSSGTIALSLLADFNRIPRHYRALLLDTVHPIPKDCVYWRLLMLCGFTPQPAHLPRLTLPTLILASGRDRLLPSVAEARWLEQHLPESYPYLLPQSGHICLLERDLRLVDYLRRAGFLPHQPQHTLLSHTPQGNRLHSQI